MLLKQKFVRPAKLSKLSHDFVNKPRQSEDELRELAYGAGIQHCPCFLCIICRTKHKFCLVGAGAVNRRLSKACYE